MCGGTFRVPLNGVLAMNWRNAVACLLTWNIAFVSGSVESAAIVDYILLVHEVTTLFKSPTYACIDRRSGKMLANAEST